MVDEWDAHGFSPEQVRNRAERLVETWAPNFILAEAAIAKATETLDVAALRKWLKQIEDQGFTKTQGIIEARTGTEEHGGGAGTCLWD